MYIEARYNVTFLYKLKVSLFSRQSVSLPPPSRVEGLSESAEKVIITDVVYSTENKTLNEEEEGEGEGDGKEEGKGEYERLKGVIAEKEKELKHLQFSVEALVKEKGLLQQFAGHVARVSSGKVQHHACVNVYVCE